MKFLSGYTDKNNSISKLIKFTDTYTGLAKLLA
jgi:hypothetical protein